MATVMEFTSPADELPLGTVFENSPRVTINMERLLPQEDLIIPYFWVRGAAAEDIEAAFETHAGLVTLKLIDSVDDEYLMRAEWETGVFRHPERPHRNQHLRPLRSRNESGWDFEVRCESREAISDFRTNCQAHDIPIEITAVHQLLPIQGDDYELTDTQREALVLAYERGYFDSPREASLEDIAAELGITQQSLSSQLRRGHRRLIGGTLINQ